MYFNVKDMHMIFSRPERNTTTTLKVILLKIIYIHSWQSFSANIKNNIIYGKLKVPFCSW